MVAALLVLPSSLGGIPAASAEAGQAISSADATLINEFVGRINTKWQLGIKPADYEVQRDEGMSIVKPRNAPRVHTSAVRNDVGGTSSGSTTTIAPPPPQLDSRAGIQQETLWYTPTCYGRLSDALGVGYMDTCSQWGDMNYQGQTRWNYAFRAYATCGAASPGQVYLEVDECYVDTVRRPGSPQQFWNDWSPRSTQQFNPCGTYQMEIAWGPVTGARQVSTCEQLVPDKGADPADFRSTWIGDSYYHSDVRETAFVISTGTPIGSVPSMTLTWSYVYSYCEPGGIFDPCG
jgi:hypothetical protein